MDTGSCGFQLSAREIDLLAAPEEEFNSRNSISSLLNSAPAAAPDPAASLQQSFFDAIASYLDHSAPRPLNSLPNAENWPHLPQRKGLQRSFNQAAVDSQVPAELIISSNHPSQVQVQLSAQPSPAAASNMGSIGGVVQQKPYATGASTSAAEHLEAGEWSHAARAARPSGGSASATSDSGTAKAGKKRSRASRRAPTTVLTTDTSNFRAMVQEFTGIPTAPFSAAPFPRSRVDFLGAPRSSLHGGAAAAAAPPFLLRPYPLRTSSTAPPPAANFGYAPPAANSAAPPPSFLLQSLLQAQQQQQQPPPPKDSISFPAGSFAGKTPGGLLEELGLSVVLPDLVPSDSSACKNMMSNYNAVKDRVSERRSSPLEEPADRNPPRAERSIVDSWINPTSG